MFFSHRILRFLNPLLLFVFIVAFSIGVIFLNFYIFLILFALFVVFIVVPNKVGKFLKYFVMTIFAMFLGFVNYIEGDLKPFWNPRGGE
jgi:energy-coupling factor transporter transmembrane protein EcfT